MRGLNRPLHKRRARLAWPYLAKRANSKKPPFKYAEIAQKAGVHWRAVGWFLGEIQTYCKAKGLPPLQAMVVRADTGLPGRGYHGSARTPAAHAKAVAAVHKRRWSVIPPAL
jgi:hypothetical protein